MLEWFKQLVRYKEVFYYITLKEIKIRYKQTLLGILWAILQPLSLMIIFTVVFSVFVRIPTGNTPYPLFSYIGLLSWTFFSNSLTLAIPSLVNNRAILTKIYFPREIFPLSCVATSFFDFTIAALLFIGMLFYFHIEVSLIFLKLIPLLLLQIIFTTGITLFFSALNVYYRDIKHIIPLAILIWMFLSPIIYPVTIIPERLRHIYMLNPMAYIINGYRKIILYNGILDTKFLIITSITCLITFIIGYGLFKKIEMSLADVV